MPVVNEQLDEQTVSADAPAGAIIVPEARHPTEVVWYGIVAPAAQDIRLVKAVGDTQGQLIPQASGLVILGPFRIHAVNAGQAGRFLHSAVQVNVPVVVYRSG